MDCKHKNIETKRVTFSNGTEHLQRQCLDCNRKLGYAPKNNPIKDEDKMFLKKHKGITYGEVFEKDLDYLMWIAIGDHKMEDLRVKVREYLKSKGVVIE
jgi:hypothetical protein